MASQKISIEDIQRPIQAEMAAFEPYFSETLKSDHRLLDKISHYIIKRKGKQMRPMLVFLCSKLMGEVNNRSYTAAALIELLHTATLVHDDVVDDAMTRRGFFSVNALWKNKIAVLVGDYLLSKGLLISVEKDTFDLLKISAAAIQEMSEGELLQQERSRRMNVDEDIYFQIIQQKTASLIAACCQMGGAAVYATEDDQRKLYVLGQKIGLAFQIKDDLLDIGFGENIGKPIGADIQEHKLTLPLIHALKNGSNDCKKKIKSILKKKNIDASDIKLIQDELISSNSIQYSEDIMRKITDEALDILQELPAGEVNQSLQQLVRYSIERKK